MRKIYLASHSKAREELLRLFGLKFQVLPSKVKETRRTNNLSYARLVKKNALAKAKEVAGRVKNGIILGADTIVVQGKHIFGKPRNLKDAKAMLNRLSRSPQWIYTGIAIIDKYNHKILMDHEKTKVYIDKLSDKEINGYFARVSPLDKAGSFDIQGKGAFFIRRIEGCFYNVVGLPLSKVYRMLKKLKIKVFIFFFFPLALGSWSVVPPNTMWLPVKKKLTITARIKKSRWVSPSLKKWRKNINLTRTP